MAEHDAQEKKTVSNSSEGRYSEANLFIYIGCHSFSDMLLQCWRAFLMAQSVELCSGRVTAAEDYA